jgi:hypothetical protein
MLTGTASLQNLQSFSNVCSASNAGIISEVIFVKLELLTSKFGWRGRGKPRGNWKITE